MLPTLILPEEDLCLTSLYSHADGRCLTCREEFRHETFKEVRATKTRRKDGSFFKGTKFKHLRAMHPRAQRNYLLEEKSCESNPHYWELVSLFHFWRDCCAGLLLCVCFGGGFGISKPPWHFLKRTDTVQKLGSPSFRLFCWLKGSVYDLRDTQAAHSKKKPSTGSATRKSSFRVAVHLDLPLTKSWVPRLMFFFLFQCCGHCELSTVAVTIDAQHHDDFFPVAACVPCRSQAESFSQTDVF